MPRQRNEFDHQVWWLVESITFVVFNHLKENILTFSSKWVTGLAAFLNKRWFRSFHRTQTQASQIICKNDCRPQRPPTELVNWTKWAGRVWASTAEKPIQERTSVHKGPKVLQSRNKCWADSTPPHPDTKCWSSGEIMLRPTKFDFVGSLKFNLIMFQLFLKDKFLIISLFIKKCRVFLK
jgi:hypothetical protein